MYIDFQIKITINLPRKNFENPLKLHKLQPISANKKNKGEKKNTRTTCRNNFYILFYIQHI